MGPSGSALGSGSSGVIHAAIALASASEPWAFSQEHPLTTSDFCEEAKKRGVPLREEQLPELWRVGLLAPFVEIRNKAERRRVSSPVPEPRSYGTWQGEIRAARDSGRLVDPAERGFRPQLRFWRPPTIDRSRRWWNGLLYTRWQLIGLREMSSFLAGGRWRRDDRRLKWRSPTPNEGAVARATRNRGIAAILVALEARYLPTIEAQWINLSGAEVAEWEGYVRTFDPEAVLQRLGTEPDELLKIADKLLIGLHRLDPFPSDWSELVRRAPRRTWSDLAGNALFAMDFRIAAEILVRCYEDLADRGLVPPLREKRGKFHMEAERERVSYRSQTLDANLSSLGISPHPGVVLVVEGETEEVLIPLVRDHVRIPNRAELIQSVVMRGVGRDLTKLAAFASAPLIDRMQLDAWLVVKPPTRLMVVVDPDPAYDTPAGVDAARKKIVDEIATIVQAQGVDPLRGDIDSLVSIRTWTERCFEFEHFTDPELADTLLNLHPDCGGLNRDRLIAALAEHRIRRQDIKTLWRRWRPRVQKTELAKRLWPLLRAKLTEAQQDEAQPVPSVAQVIIDAYHSAASRPWGHFVIRGTSLTYVEGPPHSRPAPSARLSRRTEIAPCNAADTRRVGGARTAG
ncbi:MAG: hypothetical protein M0020_09995 [Actinomycetota bacterium]|nr:hypothetical protein [Actinomycetota bacterium]